MKKSTYDVDRNAIHFIPHTYRDIKSNIVLPEKQSEIHFNVHGAVCSKVYPNRSFFFSL